MPVFVHSMRKAASVVVAAALIATMAAALETGTGLATSPASAAPPGLTVTSGTIQGGTAVSTHIDALTGTILATTTGGFSGIISREGYLFNAWGRLLADPDGTVFTKVSGAICGNEYMVTAIDSTGRAFTGQAGSGGTVAPVTLPAGTTAVETWDYGTILLSDGRLISPAGTVWQAPGIQFVKASAACGANGYIEVSAISSAAEGYYGSTTNYTLTRSTVPTPVTATASYAAVVGNGALYRPWGPAWTMPTGIGTITQISGSVYRNRNDSVGDTYVEAIDDSGAVYRGQWTAWNKGFIKVTMSKKAVETADHAVIRDETGALFGANGAAYSTGAPVNGAKFSSATGVHLADASNYPDMYALGVATDGRVFRLVVSHADQNALVVGSSYTVTGVTVGGVAATNVSASNGTVTFTTPAHAPGVVDVVVSTKKSDNSAGPSFTLPGAYTYVVPVPVVGSVGSVVGGVHAISGTGLVGATLTVANSSGTVLGTATVAANGSWSTTVPAGSALPLSVIQTVSGTSSAAVSIESLPVPRLEVTLSADPTELVVAGDAVALELTISNSGNVPVSLSAALSSVSATGSLPGVSSCGFPATLAAASSVSCTVSYVLTQADANARSVQFTLSASGTTTDHVTVTDTASATVTAGAVTSEDSVIPSTGPISGGNSVEITLPRLLGRFTVKTIADYGAVIGSDGLVYTPSGELWPTPAGLTFTKVSTATLTSSYTVLVSAIASNGSAYVLDWYSQTAVPISLPTGVTAVDTWDMVAILGSDGKLYAAWSGAPWPTPAGVTFRTASGHFTPSVKYVSAISDTGVAYAGTWSGTASFAATAIPAPAQATADYAVVIDRDGYLWSPTGTQWDTPAGVTFTAASGLHVSTNFFVSAIGNDGRAYVGNFSAARKVNLVSSVTERVVSTKDFAVMIGSSGLLYDTWGTPIPLPAGATAAAATGWNDSTSLFVQAIGSDGFPYVYVAASPPAVSGMKLSSLKGAPFTVTSVTFGGVAATNVVQSSTDRSSVSAVVPAHAPGVVDVVVATKKSDGSAGPTFTLPGAYTYVVPVPVVGSVGSPVEGRHTVSGSGIAGSTVTVSNSSGTVLGTATVAANGSWSTTVPAGSALPLSVIQTVSGTSSAAVSIESLPVPRLEVTLSADPTELAVAGDAVSLALAVSNTGNTALTLSAELTSPSATGSLPGVSSCGFPETLAAASSVSCTLSYVLTQADVNARSVQFTLSASGTTTDHVTVTDTASATVTTKLRAGLTVTPASIAAVSAVGEVPVSVTVKNTGNMTVAQLNALAGTPFGGSGSAPVFTCTPSSLTPDEEAICSGSYELVQADLDRVPATVTIPVDVSVRQQDLTTTSESAELSIPVTQTPAVAVAVSASGTPTRAGDIVSLSATVANTGNVSMMAASVTTVSAGSGTASVWSCPSTAIAPDSTVVCTSMYTLSQADVDQRLVTFTVSASAKDPQGVRRSSSPDSTTVSIATTASVGATVTTTPTSPATLVAGATVSVSAKVKNTGTVTVSGVSAVVSSVSPTVTLSCPTGAVAPGASVTCSGQLTVTQAHVDQGTVPVTVDPAASTPSDVAGASVSADLTITRTSAVTASATASPTTMSQVGQVITYTVRVSNAGSTTVSDPAVTVSRFTGSGSAPTWDCGGATTIAPTETVTCTGTSVVTQSDLDRGSIVADLAARGVTPQGTKTSSTVSVTVRVSAAPSVAVAVSDPAPATRAGQTVTVTAVLSNTGNVTISSPQVTSTEGPELAFTCAGPVAPTSSISCTASYVVTQEAADAGSVSFTVVGRGTSPTGTTVASATAPTARLTVTALASLSVSVSVSGAGTPTAKGDPVSLTAVVRNTGGVTLHSVSLSTVQRDGGATAPSWSCPPGDVAPNASVTCQANLAVTQGEVDSGRVTVAVVGSAVSARDATVTAPQVSATAPVVGLLAVQVTSAGVAPGTVTEPGQSAAYSFTLRNTGTITLTDAATIVGWFSAGTHPTLTCPSGNVAPGASVACGGTHTVTQADLDAGGVNIQITPTATGADPAHTAVSGDAALVNLAVSTTAALDISTRVSPSAVTSAGTTVTVTSVVTNVGTVTMHDIDVLVDLFTGSATLTAFSCAGSTLAPAATTTCTATYVVSQADLDTTPDDPIVLDAHASGATPTNKTIISEATRTPIDTVGAGAMTITGTTSSVPAAVGDPVEITATVTNTGTVTLSRVRLGGTPASTATGTAPVMTCDVTSLAPNQTATCTGTYLATQADLDHGGATLAVHATGAAPDDDLVSTLEPALVTFTAHALAEALVTVTADPTVVTAAGQRVTYRIEVRNVGTMSLLGIPTIAPTGFTGHGATPSVTCPTGVIAPGSERICTATATATQADLDAEAALSLAVTGVVRPSVGQDVSFASAPATAVTHGVSAFTATLIATPDAIAKAGDAIDYTVRITNTGTRTLSNLAAEVADSASASTLAAVLGAAPVPAVFTGTGEVPQFTCPSAGLGPDQSATCTATYHATSQDIAAAAIVLTVTATADAGFVSVHVDSSATVHVAVPARIPPALARTGGVVDLVGTTIGGVIVMVTGAALLVLAVGRRRRHHRAR